MSSTAQPETSTNLSGYTPPERFVPAAGQRGDFAYRALAPALKHWRAMMFAPMALGLVTAGLSLLLPNQYTAQTTFTANSGQLTLGSLGSLAGLAGKFGVTGAGESDDSPDFFAEVLGSRELMEATLLSRFAVTRDGRTDSLALLQLLNVSGDSERERLERGVRKLAKRTSTDVNVQTGVVTLSVELAPPPLSADVANRMITLLNEFNLRRNQERTHAQTQFLEQRLTDAAAALHTAEEQQLAFLQHNRSFSDPLLTYEANRLSRQVQIRQDLYLTLERQYEDARMQEERDTPVLTLVDRAVPPVRKSSPHRALLTLAALFVGALGATGFAYLSEYIRESRQHGSESQQALIALALQTRNDMLSMIRRQSAGH